MTSDHKKPCARASYPCDSTEDGGIAGPQRRVGFAMRQLQGRLRELTLFILIFASCIADAEEPTSLKPNIIFILADDVGAHDLGCYGSIFHRTPNIDALAARGVRFTQSYANSQSCSPTRASILSGLHPARIGITNPSCHLPTVNLSKQLELGSTARVIPAVSVTRLDTRYTTLAESLQGAGYRTAHFGKWHLGSRALQPD